MNPEAGGEPFEARRRILLGPDQFVHLGDPARCAILPGPATGEDPGEVDGGAGIDRPVPMPLPRQRQQQPQGAGHGNATAAEPRPVEKGAALLPGGKAATGAGHPDHEHPHPVGPGVGPVRGPMRLVVQLPAAAVLGPLGEDLVEASMHDQGHDVVPVGLPVVALPGEQRLFPEETVWFVRAHRKNNGGEPETVAPRL